jgi:hypothetical protein
MRNCFDSFNYKKLVSLVKKHYISQQVFVDLIYKASALQILSEKDLIFNVNMNTFKESVVSLLLCNIFFHELDKFVLESLMTAKFRNGVLYAKNLEFVYLGQLFVKEVKQADVIRKSKGKSKM